MTTDAPGPRILVLRHRAAVDRRYGGPIYTESILGLMQQRPLVARVEQLVFEEPPYRLADRLLAVAAVLRSLVSPLPAKVERFRSGRYQRRLRDRLASADLQLVLINGLDMLWCLPLLVGRVPVVYVAHNQEAALFAQRIARWDRSPVLKPRLRRDAAKLAALERRGLTESTGVIAVSQEVAEAAAALAPRTPVLWVPPTFRAPRWQPPRNAPRVGERLRLGFVGNLGWWANRVSLNWFLKAVWPHLEGAYELHLFGSGSKRLAPRPRVVRHGYVAELAEVWRTAQIMIQPMVVGAGVNIKVAEALYHRRPMIATPLALAGCAPVADPAILVADGPAAWIALLRGPEPGRLVDAQVSEANAERFAQSPQARRLGAFLGPLLASDPAPS